jgi:hypothetical protein
MIRLIVDLDLRLVPARHATTSTGRRDSASAWLPDITIGRITPDLKRQPTASGTGLSATRRLSSREPRMPL